MGSLTKESPVRKIVIVGIGNLLLRDEGIGVHVIGELENLQLPDNVEVYDCGTGGMKILDVIDGFDKAIVIDAVRGGGEAGTVYRFRLNENEAVTADESVNMASFHELDLITVMRIGRRIYNIPDEIVMIGIEPKTLEAGFGLSPEVKRSLPEVLHLLSEEIAN